MFPYFLLSPVSQGCKAIEFKAKGGQRALTSVTRHVKQCFTVLQGARGSGCRSVTVMALYNSLKTTQNGGKKLRAQLKARIMQSSKPRIVVQRPVNQIQSYNILQHHKKCREPQTLNPEPWDLASLQTGAPTCFSGLQRPFGLPPEQHALHVFKRLFIKGDHINQ